MSSTVVYDRQWSPSRRPTSPSLRFAKEVGDIDTLVNNAGFSVWGPTETFEITSFDAMFAANDVSASTHALAANGLHRPHQLTRPR